MTADTERRTDRTKLVLGLVAGMAVLALAAVGLVVATGGGGDDPPGTIPGSTAPPRTTDTRRPTSSGVVTTAVPVPGVPARVVLASATATAPNNVDRCGNPTSYEPAKAADGDLATAWRAAGDATGAVLTFTLSAPGVVTKVGLVPGFAKVDPCDGTDRFRQNRRVSSVQWRVGGDAYDQDLQDAPTMQAIAVTPGPTSTVVSLTVRGTLPPGDRDFTAISEILVEVRR